MSLWVLEDGKLIVDDLNHPLSCETCPCFNDDHGDDGSHGGDDDVEKDEKLSSKNFYRCSSNSSLE